MKYLLLDRRFLNPQGMENVILKTAKVEKDRENGVLFTEEKPWEVRIDNGYPNVLYDEKEDIYRCYYTLFIKDNDSKGVSREERARRAYRPGSDRVTGLCYAESKDGIHWVKPNLGFYEWEGSKDNNIIFPFAHGTGVMIDKHENNPKKRYKMVTKVEPEGGISYMAVSFSEDGVHWEFPTPWPEYNPPADSHNLPYWNEKEGCYELVSRIWKDGIRITTKSRSKDFVHWSMPEEVLRGESFGRQVYAMPVFEWGNLHLGFASVIHEGDRMDENFDMVDCELTWEPEGGKFDWVVSGEAVIERGNGRYPSGEPDCSCIYASPPIVEKDGDLLVYYMGGNGQHTNYRESSLMRGRLKKDKFAFYEQKREGREAILSSCRVRITGSELRILSDVIDETKQDLLQVMIAKEWNEEAMEGFAFDDSHAEQLENGWTKITFDGDLSTLKDKQCSIRIKFNNRKLWAVDGDIVQEVHRLWEGASEEELAKPAM